MQHKIVFASAYQHKNRNNDALIKEQVLVISMQWNLSISNVVQCNIKVFIASGSFIIYDCFLGYFPVEAPVNQNKHTQPLFKNLMHVASKKDNFNVSHLV